MTASGVITSRISSFKIPGRLNVSRVTQKNAACSMDAADHSLRGRALQSLSVADVLKAQTEIRPLERKNKELCNFIASHSAELLDLAFSTCSSDLAKRAFLLLSNPSKPVVRALFANSLFFVKATEVLTSDHPPDVFISRLSSLFEDTIIKTDYPLSESVGFLSQLIRFIDEPSVFSLFRSVFGSPEQLRDLQAVLVQTRFSLLILNEFNSKPSIAKLSNLCALLHVCLGNPALHTSFANEKTLEKLTGLVPSNDVLLLNQVWQALSETVNDVTVSKLGGLTKTAMGVFADPPGELHIYHVCAVDFLAKVIKCAPATFDDEQRPLVVLRIVGLIGRFPNATNLIGAVFRFVRNAAKSSRFLGLIVTIGFPVIVEQAASGARTSATARALEFLADAWRAREESRLVLQFLTNDQQFRKGAQQKLKAFAADISRPFGGPVVCRGKKSHSDDGVWRPDDL
jgi:hypothetical protein